MRVLSVELDEETVEALEAERKLFGFENRSAYVRWIVENRGSIDQGSDHGQLLADHGERIARLERRVASLSADADRATDGTETTDGDVESERGTDDSPRTSRARRDDADRNGNDGGRVDRADAATAAEPSPEPADGVEGETDDADRADEAVATPDGGTAASTSAPRRAERPSDDPPSSITSMNLTPERVARIPEDPVMEDAGELGSVESQRLDELSRRAVAKTRKRLNREVQTGLEYASSTGLSGAGVLPGEDVVDLESLSIPGRSTETVAKRRRAAGRAIAYLRDKGRARKSDFVDALYGECPAGYDTPDGWWRCIKEALKQVEAVDGGDGARVWRFES